MNDIYSNQDDKIHSPWLTIKIPRTNRQQESFGNLCLLIETQNYGRVSVDISSYKIAANNSNFTHFRVQVILIIEELTRTMKCTVEQQ